MPSVGRLALVMLALALCSGFSLGLESSGVASAHSKHGVKAHGTAANCGDCQIVNTALNQYMATLLDHLEKSPESLCEASSDRDECEASAKRLSEESLKALTASLARPDSTALCSQTPECAEESVSFLQTESEMSLTVNQAQNTGTGAEDPPIHYSQFQYSQPGPGHERPKDDNTPPPPPQIEDHTSDDIHGLKHAFSNIEKKELAQAGQAATAQNALVSEPSAPNPDPTPAPVALSPAGAATPATPKPTVDPLADPSAAPPEPQKAPSTAFPQSTSTQQQQKRNRLEQLPVVNSQPPPPPPVVPMEAPSARPSHKKGQDILPAQAQAVSSPQATVPPPPTDAPPASAKPAAKPKDVVVKDKKAAVVTNKAFTAPVNTPLTPAQKGELPPDMPAQKAGSTDSAPSDAPVDGGSLVPPPPPAATAEAAADTIDERDAGKKGKAIPTPGPAKVKVKMPTFRGAGSDATVDPDAAGPEGNAKVAVDPNAPAPRTNELAVPDGAATGALAPEQIDQKETARAPAKSIQATSPVPTPAPTPTPTPTPTPAPAATITLSGQPTPKPSTASAGTTGALSGTTSTPPTPTPAPPATIPTTKAVTASSSDAPPSPPVPRATESVESKLQQCVATLNEVSIMHEVLPKVGELTDMIQKLSAQAEHNPALQKLHAMASAIPLPNAQLRRESPIARPIMPAGAMPPTVPNFANMQNYGQMYLQGAQAQAIPQLAPQASPFTQPSFPGVNNLQQQVPQLQRPAGAMSYGGVGAKPLGGAFGTNDDLEDLGAYRNDATPLGFNPLDVLGGGGAF